MGSLRDEPPWLIGGSPGCRPLLQTHGVKSLKVGHPGEVNRRASIHPPLATRHNARPYPKELSLSSV